MKKVLLTGCSGQIGSRLSKCLIDHGFDVYGVSSRGNCPETIDSEKCIQLDLLTENIDLVMQEIRPNLLIHLAWDTRPTVFWESPENLRWSDSSHKLIESFNKCGGERIVVSGSCAEYGWDAGIPLKESDHESPKSIYGSAKLDLLNSLRTQPTPFLWARIFFQFGSNENPGRLIPSMIDALMAGHEFSVQKPNDIRDFIYVDDVVQIMTALILAEAEGVFNVGSGVGISVRDLATKIALIVNRPDLIHFQESTQEPSTVLADISKLKRMLGPIPGTFLDDAISRTIKERAKL